MASCSPLSCAVSPCPGASPGAMQNMGSMVVADALMALPRSQWIRGGLWCVYRSDDQSASVNVVCTVDVLLPVAWIIGSTLTANCPSRLQVR